MPSGPGLFDIFELILGAIGLGGQFENNAQARAYYEDVLNQRNLARQDPNTSALVNQLLSERAATFNGQGPLAGSLGLMESQVLNSLDPSAANATIAGLQQLSGMQGPQVRGTGPGQGSLSPQSMAGPGASLPALPPPATPSQQAGTAGVSGRAPVDRGGDPRGPRTPSSPPTTGGNPRAPRIPQTPATPSSPFGPSDAFNVSAPDIGAYLQSQQNTGPTSSFFDNLGDFNANGSPFDFLVHTPQTGSMNTPSPSAPGQGIGLDELRNNGIFGSIMNGTHTGGGSPDYPVFHDGTFTGGRGPNTQIDGPGLPPTGQGNGRSQWNRTIDLQSPALPSYEVGTPYVPQTGPAILHKGEAVVPANQNPANTTPGGLPQSYFEQGSIPTSGQPSQDPRRASIPASTSGTTGIQPPAVPNAPTPTGVPHPAVPQGRTAERPIGGAPAGPINMEAAGLGGPGNNGDYQLHPVVPQTNMQHGGGLMSGPPPQTNMQHGGGLMSGPPPVPNGGQGPTTVQPNLPQATPANDSNVQSFGQPPVTSGQPYLNNSLDAIQNLLNSGGPINQQVQNIQNQQVNDLAANQQLANQRNIREQMGARGLGDSGAQDFLELQARLGAQSNQIQGQNQVALDAANRNFDSLLGAGTALGNIGLGSEQLGFQRDELAQALDIANQGFDVTRRGQDTQQNIATGNQDVTRRGQDIEEMLGLGNQEVTRRGQDTQQNIASGNQDVTRRGQDISQETAYRGQDIEQMLGEGNLEVTRRGQDVSADVTRRGQDIQSDLGNRGYDIEESQGNRSLDLQEQNILGNLDLGQARIDLESQLGNRGLDIDEFNAFVNRDLGLGNLQLGQDTLASGNFFSNAELQRQLGLDQFTIHTEQQQQMMNFITDLFNAQLQNGEFGQAQLDQLMAMLGDFAYPSGTTQEPAGAGAPRGGNDGSLRDQVGG